MSQLLEIKSLFPSDYEECLALQLELVRQRARDEIPDTLILTEHQPIFTVGRRSSPASLPQSKNIPVLDVTRGGDITYHGPGQVVGYWIRKLKGRDRDLHAHLRILEDAVINMAHAFGVDADRILGLTGVWVGEAKIASIGVAVRSWVTYHGFALNVDVDPGIYGEFRPCGLDGNVMSDLSRSGAPLVTTQEVAARAMDVFSSLYRRQFS